MKKKKTVLVVEDEKSLRGALATMLRLKKFQPIEAKNGKEGIELALSKHPDLILLDLIMPEVDGITVLRRIRQDSWGERVPVIILTNISATSEHLVNDLVLHRPESYLIKSDWKLTDVMQKVEEILATEN